MHLMMFLAQSELNQQQAMQMVMAMMAIMPIIFLVCLAVIIIPFWFICKKAGFSPWLSLLCIIPSLGTLVLLYVLAFAEWKTPGTAVAYQPPYPPPPPPPYPPRA